MSCRFSVLEAEAATLELENRQLRRQLQKALEFQARQPIPTEAASGPEKAAPPSPRLPPALLQALAEESEYSEDEEEFRKRSEKKLKEMIASNKWRKLASGRMLAVSCQSKCHGSADVCSLLISGISRGNVP
eukprot:g8197.t1